MRCEGVVYGGSVIRGTQSIAFNFVRCEAIDVLKPHSEGTRLGAPRAYSFTLHAAS